MTLSTTPLFGTEAFSSEEFVQINKKLDEVLHDDISYRQGTGGVRLAYVEGWKLIKLANDIFGFNGWSTSILSICTEFVDSENGRFALGITCTARVTLKDGSFHEDVGFGSAENFKSKGLAFEKAKKEAVTDATKRALRHFGYALGLSTYDKEYLSDLTKTVNNAKDREILEMSKNACARQNPQPMNIPNAAPLPQQQQYNQPQRNNAVNFIPNGNTHNMEMVPNHPPANSHQFNQHLQQQQPYFQQNGQSFAPNNPAAPLKKPQNKLF